MMKKMKLPVLAMAAVLSMEAVLCVNAEMLSDNADAGYAEEFSVPEEILQPEAENDGLADEQIYTDLTEDISLEAGEEELYTGQDEALIEVIDETADNVPDLTAEIPADELVFEDEGDSVADSSEAMPEEDISDDVPALTGLTDDKMTFGNEDTYRALADSLNQAWSDAGPYEDASAYIDANNEAMHQMFPAGFAQDSDEPAFVGYNYFTELKYNELRDYLLKYGYHSTGTNYNYYGMSTIVNRTTDDGTQIQYFFLIEYSPDDNDFVFGLSIKSNSTGNLYDLLNLKVSYGFKPVPSIMWYQEFYDEPAALANGTILDPSTYNGSNTLSFIVERAVYDTDEEINRQINLWLSRSFERWEELLSTNLGMSMGDLGFGKPDKEPTISLSASSVTLLPEQSKRITVSGMQSGDAVASWKSADTSIATVSSLGRISAVKHGTTTVTVTLKSGLTANIKVTVDRKLFSDVTDPTAFYYEPIYWAVDEGITTGYSDNTFRPNNNCNRAAVVTFLWRLAGKPAPSKTASFKDMTGNADFDTAISWASEKGITTGYSDNTFRPWATCNRAAIVTFLWRYAGKPAPTVTASFKDLTGNSDFDTAISWAAENNITTGYTDNTFRPWNQCLRLAIVSFLYRYAHL